MLQNLVDIGESSLMIIMEARPVPALVRLSLSHIVWTQECAILLLNAIGVCDMKSVLDGGALDAVLKVPFFHQNGLQITDFYL